MSSRDGPPARNTHLASRTARNEQTRAIQDAPSREGSQRPERSDATARSDNTAPQEGSELTSLDGDNRQSEEDDTASERDTIREEIPEHEQNFTTAPGSLGPSANPVGPRSPPLEYRGGRHSLSTPSQGEDNTSQSSRREARPRVTSPRGVWERIEEALDRCSTVTEDINAEAIQQRQEMKELQKRVINLYHHTTDAQDAIRDIRQMFEQARAEYEGQCVPHSSPHALATQALYAERGSNEGTIEYERRRSAQTQFETSRFDERPRTEGINDNTSPPEARAQRSRINTEGYKRQMAESRARAARQRSHGRTSGPPVQVQEREGGDHIGTDRNERELLREDEEPHKLDQREHTNGRDARNLDYVDAAAYASNARNVLDRDYACRSMSAQPQQLMTPIAFLGPRQGQSRSAIAPPVPILGQIDTDHEIRMIEDLRPEASHQRFTNGDPR